VLATGYAERRTRIWRLDLARGVAAALSALGDDAHAARYSADGRWIYWLRGGAPARALWRIDAALAAPPVLLAANVDQFRLDAERLAYTRADREGLTLCAADGGDCRELDVAIEREFRGAWALARGNVYFLAVRDDRLRRALFRQPLAGGAREEIDAPIPNAVGAALAVAPDESFLITAHNDRFDVDLMYVPPIRAGD
jgi:hypothetical protein